MGAPTAASIDEIKPLVNLCKAGRLFDVQAWIKSGKPVNLPPPQPGRRHKSPLEYAIDLGFHSMVEVLLQARAEVLNDRYNALEQAVRLCRLDLAELLLAHGADLYSVDMDDVFDTYDPEIMEFFIERGADVEADHPLARALCYKIRPALRIYKHYHERFPSFQEQANLALRYHCRKGNQKWIALMLWLGADLYAQGTCELDCDPEDGLQDSALGFAAFYGHHEIFDMKKIRLDPKHPESFDLVRSATFDDKADLLARLLSLGFPVNDEPDGGSSLYRLLIQGISFQFDLYSPRQQKNIDSERSREKLKMVHLIAKHGAKWIPKERHEVGSFRRELLKMDPNYTAELVWIMTKYTACKPELLTELMRTDSIRKHACDSMQRIEDLNALNAVMAVIKWKKIRGFYRDLEHEHHSTYTTDGNMLTNEDH